MERPPGIVPALLAAMVLLAACGSDAASVSDPDSAEATPPSLAAAVVAHYDEPLVAASALLPDEFEELLSEDTLAVELAFDRPEGDNTHVRVIVSPDDPFAGDEHEFPDCSVFECEDISTGEVEATLLYENGSPEEDPGLVAAIADQGDHVVFVRAYGPFVPLERDDLEQDAEVMALGDAVGDIATDPAVGFRTSAAYASGGEGICAGDDWLDWFGQGNGYPRPDDYVDYC
ncbi:hypothetical protein [Nocardioides aquaticus]|nr:hypothetical protein [Nocardioides aquaticus]